MGGRAIELSNLTANWLLPATNLKPAAFESFLKRIERSRFSFQKRRFLLICSSPVLGRLAG